MNGIGRALKSYVYSSGWIGIVGALTFLSGIGGLVSDAMFGVGPIHMPPWAWVAVIVTAAVVAPFGAFYNLFRKYESIRSELDAKNAWKRATKDDVIPIFHELASRDFVQTKEESEAWFQEANVRVRECLKETYADDILHTMQQMFNDRRGPQRTELELVKSGHSLCALWLSQWEERLENHHVNPNFMVPT